MKVLFLDVDGVLNSMEFFAKQDPKTIPYKLSMIDPKAVERVMRVLEATGAKLVLSSTWRLYPETVAKLKAAGLPLYTEGTPDFAYGRPRSHEILSWLLGRDDVENFAIIDDDRDAGYGLEAHFVHTHAKYGMYGKHEKALIEILNA